MDGRFLVKPCGHKQFVAPGISEARFMENSCWVCRELGEHKNGKCDTETCSICIEDRDEQERKWREGNERHKRRGLGDGSTR